MLLILLCLSSSFLLEFELEPVLIYLHALVWNLAYLCKILEGKSDQCLQVNRHWCIHWTSLDLLTGNVQKLELQQETRSRTETDRMHKGFCLNFFRDLLGELRIRDI